MSRGDPRDWMWSEALQMLAQADRLHRQMFKPNVSQQRRANWEPPVDMLETEDKVLILAALPGVDAAQVRAVIQDGVLVITGERVLPDELRTAVIHRLELPQGWFERRIELPAGRYDGVKSVTANGCLVISLTKAKAQRSRT
jgi:HSP20 family protein